MSDTSDTLDDGPYSAKAGLPPASMPQDVALDNARPDARPAKADRLGKRTVQGSLWTVLTYLALNVVRLATNLVLTRLLAPELFGTMLIVNTVMVGIRLFSDVGIGPAVISNPRGDDERFLRTAFTVQVFRGFVIWIVACALTVPVAHFYGVHNGIQDPAMYDMLLKLLPVAGFSAVIEGLRSTAIFRVQRDLRFGPLSIMELTEMAFSSIGMVVWAHVFGATVWALLIPPLLGNVLGAVLSHTVLYHDRRDRFGFDRESSREMMRIGRWIFLSTLVTFFASQFDRLIFGKLIDPATLGVYSIAVNLAVMPLNAVLKIGSAVLFPTFSRVANQPERFRDVYGRARSMLLVAGATIVCGMIACGPFVIPALYKSEFDKAGWMLQFLAIGCWFQVVDASNSAALMSHQRPVWIFGANLTKALMMFALVPLAYHLPGSGAGLDARMMCAFVALAIADAGRAIVSTVGARRAIHGSVQWLSPDTMFPLLIAAVGIGAWQAAKHLAGATLTATTPPTIVAATATKGFDVHEHLNRFVTFGKPATIAAAIVLLVWLPICLWQWRRSKRGSASEVQTATPAMA